MDRQERSGIDEAKGRWTQVDIGKIVLDRSRFGGGEDEVRVYLWRRVPSPIPPRLTAADYRLTVIVDWMGESFSFDADDAEQLAKELPALLRAAATRARQG